MSNFLFEDEVAGTATGDVANIEKPIGGVQKRNDEKPYREPDCLGPYGYPAFTCKDSDNMVASKLLDGKGKYKRWDSHVEDSEIGGWVRKNPNKSFYLKVKDVFFRVK